MPAILIWRLPLARSGSPDEWVTALRPEGRCLRRGPGPGTIACRRRSPAQPQLPGHVLPQLRRRRAPEALRLITVGQAPATRHAPLSLHEQSGQSLRVEVSGACIGAEHEGDLGGDFGLGATAGNRGHRPQAGFHRGAGSRIEQVMTRLSSLPPVSPRTSRGRHGGAQAAWSRSRPRRGPQSARHPIRVGRPTRQGCRPR